MNQHLNLDQSMRRTTPDLLAHLPEVFSSLVYHLKQPAISVTDYRSRIKARLTQRITYSHRLYIDTNHWTHLRDANLGRARDPRYDKLLPLLESLTGESLVTVPASDQLLDEITYQADKESRRASARIFDLITMGAMILGWQQRRYLEVVHWVDALNDEAPPFPGPEAWVMLSEALGFHEWQFSHPDKAVIAAVLKAAEDVVRIIGLSGVIDRIEYDVEAKTRWGQWATELTQLKKGAWSACRDFDTVLLDESLAYLDKIFIDAPQAVQGKLKELPMGDTLDEPYLVANAKRAFIACQQERLLPTSLPALRIIAGGHSRIRVEGGRKFKPGDGNDLFHAAAALPYCDSFLTDHSMRHLLTTPPTDFASLYNCHVISSPDEAIALLSMLN